MIPTSYTLAELRAVLNRIEATSSPGGDAGPESPVSASRMFPDSWRDEVGVAAVAGVAAGCGATTTALGVAEATGAARLVELCPRSASGLVEATTAELGGDRSWRLGRRPTGLLIERRDNDGRALINDRSGDTVVDLGCDVEAAQVFTSGYMGPLLVTTWCSLPGLRRLRDWLEAINHPTVVQPVVIGPELREWPKRLRAQLPTELRQPPHAGGICTLPWRRDLYRWGIGPHPLPKGWLQAITNLIQTLEERTSC